MVNDDELFYERKLHCVFQVNKRSIDIVKNSSGASVILDKKTVRVHQWLWGKEEEKCIFVAPKILSANWVKKKKKKILGFLPIISNWKFSTKLWFAGGKWDNFVNFLSFSVKFCQLSNLFVLFLQACNYSELFLLPGQLNLSAEPLQQQVDVVSMHRGS